VSSGPKPLWTRPEEGALKLNIDGAYVMETGQTGRGGPRLKSTRCHYTSHTKFYLDFRGVTHQN
jgi:hypothetical protein